MSLIAIISALLAGLAGYVGYCAMSDSLFFAKIYNIVQLFKMLLGAKKHAKTHLHKRWSFVDEFEKLVDNNPQRIQFITVEDNKEYSLLDMDHLANQIGRWARNVGVVQQETVALVMLNRPDLVTFWLGIGKIGARTALINSNSTGKALKHSVELSLQDSNTKVAVVDSSLREKLSGEVAELRATGISVFFWDELRSGPLCDGSSSCSVSNERIDKAVRADVKENDPLIYIFTSGTTGLPKASKISSSRYKLGALPGSIFMSLRPGDRVYNCLPLYHSAGGMMALGACLVTGATMVLRKKFSASNFTLDCIKYKITAMQYIGELCRYLANAPPNADDALVGRTLRVVMGNGMRPDVWPRFQKRYGIPNIVEFYSATEGNITFFNSTGQIGALGYFPPILGPLYSVKILRVDPEDKSVPYRGADGLCREADIGEVGLVVNKIDNTTMIGRFDGYSNATDTKKKILRNVLSAGDAFFNSGDLLSRDKAGFYYWSDRVGDTFRWKGENVATTEVENALNGVSGFAECTVYGVSVPNCDGRAGMAAVILSDSCASLNDCAAEFHEECNKNLAAYQRPAFIRVLRSSLAVTTTFKHQKSDLVKDGFDPKLVKAKNSEDLLFLYSQKDGKFLPLDDKLHDAIIDGSIKF